MSEYQICTRCVMDNAHDPFISFDAQGHCNYCTEALHVASSTYFPGEEGRIRLQKMIDTLKEEGQGKKYDCLMGISGGLDSAYLAYLGHKWGLRILAVHIDDGYDTPIAKNNIQKLCDKCGIDLHTITPDPVQFNDLTRSYILAEVPNLAIPQDNILFAYLYSFAKANHIHTFLSGGNFALESILQQGNTHSAYDLVNLRDIHKRFGTQPMNKLKFLSRIQKSIVDKYLLKIKTIRPLNFIDYNRERAIAELTEFCDFQYYGNKHLENTLTKITQLYWLPVKFKVDKRRSHYSSMIISGQMTRDEALRKLEEPLFVQQDMDKDVDIVLKNLNLSRAEFEDILHRPGKSHTEYKTSKLDALAHYVIQKRKE